MSSSSFLKQHFCLASLKQSKGAEDCGIPVLLAVLLLLEKGGADKRFCGVFLFSTGKKEGDALSGFPMFSILS